MNLIMAKSVTRLREYDTVHCHGSRIAHKVFFLEDEEHNDSIEMLRAENIGQTYILTLESASSTGHKYVNNVELDVLIHQALRNSFGLVIARCARPLRQPPSRRPAQGIGRTV